MGFMDLFKAKKVIRAKIIGVRTAADTKGFMTYNYGVYSFMVEYEDKTIGVVESSPDDKSWDTLISALKFD